MDAKPVMRVAAAAWPVEVLPDTAALAAKLDRWISGAAEAGARIAVIPEYAAMEAALVGDARPDDWFAAASAAAPGYRDIVAALAEQRGIAVLSGSGPVAVGDVYLNRAWLCLPGEAPLPVDKHVLTPWERDHTPMVPGDSLRAAELCGVRLGALICYDSEFPTLTRALDPEILLIPACTDTPAGQGRLRTAARARALEAQCITIHAPLLGSVPHCPLIDTNTGKAGIYVPSDRGLPPNGVLAQGRRDSPGWTIADAPVGLIRSLRDEGEVTLRADWIVEAPPVLG